MNKHYLTRKFYRRTWCQTSITSSGSIQIPSLLVLPQVLFLYMSCLIPWPTECIVGNLDDNWKLMTIQSADHSIVIFTTFYSWYCNNPFSGGQSPSIHLYTLVSVYFDTSCKPVNTCLLLVNYPLILEGSGYNIINVVKFIFACSIPFLLHPLSSCYW